MGFLCLDQGHVPETPEENGSDGRIGGLSGARLDHNININM